MTYVLTDLFYAYYTHFREILFFFQFLRIVSLIIQYIFHVFYGRIDDQPNGIYRDFPIPS